VKYIVTIKSICNEMQSHVIFFLIPAAFILALLTVTLLFSTEVSDNKNIKKILYVASYNFDTEWGREIKTGIESTLKSRDDVQYTAITMDTMGMSFADSEKIKKAALKAKNIIDNWKPDVVITSDDNAAKYLIVPYYKRSELPFVFCGINWDASKYGFPSENVTGMVEVYLVDQLVKYLRPYAKGNRIGSIRGNTTTDRMEAEYFEQQCGAKIKTYFVENITDWKKRFVQLQDEVDMILLGDIDAVKFNNESPIAVENYMLAHSRIPSGRWDVQYKNDALITIGIVPREQGEYATAVALQILDGKSPLEIPIVKNKHAQVYLNMKLAKQLGIVFPIKLIESAAFVEDN
jgi:ABC-type uncharacterized transport system substrate-binding protein